MSGGELPLKNKINADEQNISLFDGQEDLINEIPETETEAVENTSESEAEIVSEENTTPFVIEEIEEETELHYDESEITDEPEKIESEEASEDISENAEEETEDADEEISASDEAPEQTEAKKAAPSTEEKPRRIDSIFDFVELFIFTLAAVFLITTFFFKYSNVVGSSMEGTLKENDKLLLTNIFYRPEQGDIVVIDDRTFNDPIIKRVIAVGSQKVKITPYAIYVDGEKLVEDYVFIDDRMFRYSVVPCEALKDDLVDYEPGEYYEILVPENEIFVMGDHRNNSTDSRDIGTINEDRVLGKAIYRFAPFDKAGKIE